MIGIGTGIAIAGIWIGVGMVGLNDGVAACVAAFIAMLVCMLIYEVK